MTNNKNRKKFLKIKNLYITNQKILFFNFLRKGG